MTAPQTGPQPVPQTITVSEATGGDRTFVVVQINGPTGVYVSFLDPEIAERLAGQLADVAMHAKTGLIVASGLAGLNGHEQS